MNLLQKFLKGYFLWSIPFFCFTCKNNSVSVSEKPDPANCEWYVDFVNPESKPKNKLDVYALRFYPDSNYTLCADLLFEQGKWYNDTERKLLILKANRQGSTRYITSQVLPGNRVQFAFYNQPPEINGEPEEIISVKGITNRSSSDPYSQGMHSWRKRPLQPESKREIQLRVLGYIRFLKAFYTHAKDNRLENPGGTWYPKPILFYNNKVRMAYDNELVEWYACFYSESEALDAYNLIAGALQQVKIKGEDDNSRNINCINQLLAMIDK